MQRIYFKEDELWRSKRYIAVELTNRIFIYGAYTLDLSEHQFGNDSSLAKLAESPNSSVAVLDKREMIGMVFSRIFVTNTTNQPQFFCVYRHIKGRCAIMPITERAASVVKENPEVCKEPMAPRTLANFLVMM